MRFRFGAEFGTFGFEDAMPPKTAELKGITAMGITSFPVGPGKSKFSVVIIGFSYCNSSTSVVMISCNCGIISSMGNSI